MINTRLIYASLIIPALILAILILYPNLDIEFSALFYAPSSGFIYRNRFIVLFFFKVIPILTKMFITGCIIYLLYKLLKCQGGKNFLFSSSFYLVVAGLVGPGLIVNYTLKENCGRARPSQITYFQGSKDFSPALSISNQCDHNCSFASGHAAMAFYFTALAYSIALYNLKKSKNFNQLNENSLLLPKKKNIFTIIYIIIIIFGLVVGFSRILMGGHFLSDVVASCFIVLSVNYLLYLWWQKLRKI